ncbi:hypothetical protein FRB96_007063 [Tulasnella sp. 330]|nr:hypothetical protein FRB96_007063 [Tulasnella sp. 330]KAG8875981.1 hypothetical protein FRB97_004531 [Tulasnella sp. 331]KAG8886782.1 hypothetical protein FRB98_001006 [Tulasnella sp. 332]
MPFGVLEPLIARLTRTIHVERPTPSKPRNRTTSSTSQLVGADHRRPMMTSPVLRSYGVNGLDCFQQEALSADLEASIHYFERAEDLASPGGQLKLISLCKYAVALLARFGRKGDTVDLNNAACRLKELLEIQSLDHPLRPLTIKALAEAPHLRLHSSIPNPDTAFERAIEFLLNDVPESLKALEEGYVASKGGLDSIMKETKLRESGLGTTSVGQPPLTTSASWQRSMNSEELNTNIGFWQMIFQGMPPSDHNRPESLKNLAVAIQSRFDKSGDRVDLETTIRLHEEAL